LKRPSADWAFEEANALILMSQSRCLDTPLVRLPREPNSTPCKTGHTQTSRGQSFNLAPWEQNFALVSKVSRLFRERLRPFVCLRRKRRCGKRYAAEQLKDREASGFSGTSITEALNYRPSPFADNERSQVMTEVSIPDGAGARDALFSARFNKENKETEMLFRQVYKILKDRNYPVMMVEEGAGGDFGTKTATFLGRLRKHKGVLLAVCSSHYGEITGSTYSSYEEVKFAHGHKLDILPLRMCEDPWPPEPPSGPDHAYDKEGAAEGLLAMAIPPSKIFVDCRGKDAQWIAVKIAETLRPKPGEGDGSGPSPSTVASVPEAKGATSGASPSTAKAASPKDAEGAGFLPSPHTAASSGPEAKGAHTVGSSSTLAGPIASALRKDKAGGSKDPAASAADAAATAEPKAGGLDDEEAKAAAPSSSRSPADAQEAKVGEVSFEFLPSMAVSMRPLPNKAVVPSASPSLADAAEPKEWFNLGRKGGGERNGQRYSEQDGAARVHVGRGTEYQGCYVKALELDEKYANAWYNLGVEGGGTVKGQAYDEKAQNVPEPKSSQSFAVLAILFKLPKSIRFGRFGLGSPFQLRMWPVFEVNHRCPGPLQGCHVKALELDEKYANAWRNLGVEGGGTVKGQAYDGKDCFVRALELNENDARSWRQLGNAGGGTVRGTHYGPDECKAKAAGK
ncbi:unnamed protein product, partial [Symbiodinium sp. KB8]